MIELVREKEIDLYNQYFAARTIKDLGVRKAVKEAAAVGVQDIEPVHEEKEESLKS